MKTIFLSIPFILIFSCSFAQYTDAPFRLFGEVATVDNQIYRGFISWGGIKNYWIDFFEASKPQNPYSSFFSDSDEVFSTMVHKYSQHHRDIFFPVGSVI